MTIRDRNLKSGDVLVAMYKGTSYRCDVISAHLPEKDKDAIFYRVQDEDGRHAFGDYASPSAAGAAVTGTACNGWAFWNRRGEALEPKAERKQRARKAKGWDQPTVSVAPPAPGKRAANGSAHLTTCVDCGRDVSKDSHYHSRAGLVGAEMICCPCAKKGGYRCRC